MAHRSIGFGYNILARLASEPKAVIRFKGLLFAID